MANTKEEKPKAADRSHSSPAEPDAKARAEANEECSAAARDQASRRFVKDLQVREEVARVDSDGKLPLSATHVAVEENEDGTVKAVKRARFKAF